MKKSLTPSQVLQSPKSPKHPKETIQSKSTKHLTATTNAQKFDDSIKKLYQLPAKMSTIDAIVMEQDGPSNSIPKEASPSTTTHNPSNISDNSNILEADSLGYAIFGNLEIAMMLDLPLAAFHMFKYLVNQSRLPISDATIMDVLSAKYLLFSSMLSNNLCCLVFPLSTSISSSHLQTFIRTSPEQINSHKIPGLTKQIQHHSVFLLKSTYGLSSHLPVYYYHSD
jgi:hypothetical protein